MTRAWRSSAVAGLSVVAALAGCGRAPSDALNAAADSPPATQADYQAAPDVTAVSAGPAGQWVLSGTASPGAAVRLASPGGEKQFATADGAGRWRIALPGSAAPRLLGLSMTHGGPVVQAMGYIFVAPDGETARLRSGGGAEVLTPSARRLTPLALDYDKQRAAVLSGVASPGETVMLRVDGVERGRVIAGRAGRFAVSLQRLDAGDHTLDLSSDTGQTQAKVTIDEPAPLASGPFAAVRHGRDWRIDWLTPGGGEQTTVLLGPPAPGG
jgi:hypothetical protein